MPVILQDLLHKNHSAPLCSKSGFVAVVVIILTLVLPVNIVVITHSKYLYLTLKDWWQDTLFYYE